MSVVNLRAAGTPASRPCVDVVAVVLGCVEGAMSCNVHVGDADHSDYTAFLFFEKRYDQEVSSAAFFEPSVPP